MCIFSLKDNRVSSYAEGYSAENFFFLVRLISRFIVPRFGATQVFLPVERSYWLAWPNMAEPDWLALVALWILKMLIAGKTGYKALIKKYLNTHTPFFAFIFL